MSQVRSVTIPACEQHEGYPGNAITIRLHWVCPVCGGERGEPYDTISYDGSRRLGVTGWRNACGHIDYYCDVREEMRVNGLNTPNNACTRQIAGVASADSLSTPAAICG